MTLLEDHAKRFWTSMQKLKSNRPLSVTFARETELPTLRAVTPFNHIKIRITKELGNDNNDPKHCA